MKTALASALVLAALPWAALSDVPCCAVLELRQYTLKPGQRDVLVALFEREFVTAQQEAGMALPGRFHDLERPDRFVWLRGFPHLEARRQSLEAFYSGPVWQAHRTVANGTMLDASNVLLLQPATPTSYLATAFGRGTIVVVGIVSRSGGTPAPAAPNGQAANTFVTHAGPNTFPRLAIREGEDLRVDFTRFQRLADALRFLTASRKAAPPAAEYLLLEAL